RCNPSTWAEYSRMAEAAGVITLGSNADYPGRDWALLRPEFRPQPHLSQAQRELQSKLAQLGSTVEKTARLTLPTAAFLPLLQYLGTCLKEGKAKVMRSAACDHL